MTTAAEFGQLYLQYGYDYLATVPRDVLEAYVFLSEYDANYRAGVNGYAVAQRGFEKASTLWGREAAEAAVALSSAKADYVNARLDERRSNSR